MTAWTERLLREELSKIDAAHEARWILQDFPQEQIAHVIERRKRHEPLAYILGHWVFRDFELAVGPGVLIPRPETEELVDWVAKKFVPQSKTCKIVDFGAGTGCLGLGVVRELKKKIPGIEIELFCIEKSDAALPYLKKNVERLFPKAEIVPQDWNEFNPSFKFDLMLANPPYVTEQEYERLDSGVRDYEPRSALVPTDESRNSNALGPYLEIIRLAKSRLNPLGWLWFEIGAAQVAELYNVEEFIVDREKDMAGKLRFLGMKKIDG